MTDRSSEDFINREQRVHPIVDAKPSDSNVQYRFIAHLANEMMGLRHLGRIGYRDPEITLLHLLQETR